MTKLIFEQPDGSRAEIDARDGDSIMMNAVANAIPGIVAECRGAMACATCHVIFADEEYFMRSGQRSDNEEQMLEFAETPMQPQSRLACQVTVSPELDGAVIRVPEKQM